MDEITSDEDPLISTARLTALGRFSGQVRGMTIFRITPILHSEPNPFSTRFVSPGAMRYERIDGGTLEELAADFFDRCHGWASIVGPHGSGKSTLIANLKEVLQKRSNVHSYRFSTTDRGFQLLWNESQQWQPKDVVIVDGYEQLATWLRWRLHYRTYLRRACLLISAHNDYPTFPILWRTAVDEEQAKRLRNELLETRPDLIEAADLEVAWSVARQTHPTDMRETFMTMYDWVEMQKQKRPASHNNSRAV